MDEWEGKLHQLCIDHGAGSLYEQVIPYEDIEPDDWQDREQADTATENPDNMIAAIDSYIKAAYGVDV